MSAGTFTAPPSKKQTTSSSAGLQGRKNTYASQGSITYPRCNKCGKQHTRECGMRTGVCFRCGKPGHFAREFTQASANRGQGS